MQSRNDLLAALERAFESEGLQERPRWDRLRDWLEIHVDDDEIIAATYEAEYEQLQFPAEAPEALALLDRYLPAPAVNRRQAGRGRNAPVAPAPSNRAASPDPRAS